MQLRKRFSEGLFKMEWLMSLGAYNSLSKTDINWRLVGVAGGLFSRVNERQTPQQSASKRAAEEVSAAFSSWLHSLIYPLEKQTCQQRRLNLNRKDRSVCSFRAGITRTFLVQMLWKVVTPGERGEVVTAVLTVLIDVGRTNRDLSIRKE